VNSIKIRLIRQERVRLTPDLLVPAMEEHMAILAALASRDEARAVAALVAHLSSARERALGM
jgi:DNA-binding GntR family transcriptional regulator